MSRVALLIANSEFPESEERLSELKGPINDVESLAQVLRDGSRGKFDSVEVLKNATSAAIRAHVDAVLGNHGQQDLRLIYYAGHGLLNGAGQLLFAGKDTNPDRFASLYPVRELADLIRAYAAKSVILLLDCCHSAAADVDFRGSIEQDLRKIADDGEGKYIVCACSDIELAGERDAHGLFTGAMLEGIQTGRALRNGGVEITLADLFEYACAAFEKNNIRQRPRLFARDVNGRSPVISSTLLKGATSKPLHRKYRWKLMHTSNLIVDCMGPTYVLDSVFHFVDWNPAFERFVARPLGLTRGQHVERFLQQLRNWEEVNRRSNEVFLPGGQDPLVDIEPLEFQSEFGLIRFEKIAAQIPGEDRDALAWCVTLSVSSVEKREEFWQEFYRNQKREVNWSKYAINYDHIIGRFPPYNELEDLIVGLIPARAEYCADLGAGTGNTALRLLNAKPQRRIWACDNNGAMLARMQRKLEESLGAAEFERRVGLYKGDVVSSLREERDATFDACTMTNVLFALPDPQLCLNEVFRVLKPNGVLAFSTSRRETDVRRLFFAVKEYLEAQADWGPLLRDAFEDAFQRNRDMVDRICRDSEEDIRGYVTKAGFHIEKWIPEQYVKCVVVVQAIKPDKGPPG